MAEQVLLTCVVLAGACVVVIKVNGDVEGSLNLWQTFVVVLMLGSGIVGFADLLYLIWR